jgi:very-short-patch-repair endonuclease
VSSEGERALETRLKQLGVTGWVQEYEFASDHKWRFDFAFPDRRLAVEVEGGVWSKGRHTRGSGFIDDLAKYNAAALRGWCVLRFTTEQAIDGDAASAIQQALVLPSRVEIERVLA